MATTAPTMDEAMPMAVTPSPSKFKFRRIGLTKSMSKEKSACEFYNDDLAEGELPNLVPRSTAYMKPSSVRSVDNHVIVSPINRDSTPTHTNKEKRGRARFRKHKDESNGMSMRKKGEKVTIEARRLSPESKRKHKVFWSQMDGDDCNSSTEDNVPDDEKQDIQLPARRRNLKRDVEVMGHDDGDRTHAIITVLTDLCSDCGWTKDEKKTGNDKPDYVEHGTRSFPTENESIAVNRSRAIIDDDGSYSKQDDESLPSKATLDTLPSKATLDPSAMRSNKAYHTDAYENTAIEVEYYDAGFPDDELVDDAVEPQQKSGEGFLQLDTSGDVANFVRPQDEALSDFGGIQNKGYAMSKSKTWSVPDKSAYLQAMTKKAKEDFIKRKNADQTNAKVALNDSVDESVGELERTTQICSDFEYQNMPSAVTGSENDSRISQSFESGVSPQSAFTFRTKEIETSGFLSPNGVSDFPEMVDRESISDVGLGTKKPLLLKKVQSELPPSNSRSVKQKRFASIKHLKPGFTKIDKSGDKHQGLDAPYNMDSNGSFRSFRKKKKARDGAFYEMDDGEEAAGEEDIPVQLFDGNVVKDENEESRPNDDIFDFEDDGEDHIVNDYSPVVSVKLDPKEDSSDVSILGSMAGHGDGATVFSSRSMCTTGTNWSTSTRRRHRGAAKHRISHEDTESKRPSGWLESIKAAAERSNRRWDPKIGWIDYVEPDNEEEKEAQLNTARIGRLKTPNFKGAKEGGQRIDDTSVYGDSQSVSSQVPFPGDWEKDRERMLQNDDEVGSAMTEVVSNNPREQRNHEILLERDDGIASVMTDVVSNKLQKHNHSRKSVHQGPSVKIKYDLGAKDTIEECSEDESDSDNNSDSREVPQPPRLGHFSVYSEETEAIPEKGKLFEWIGKMDGGTLPNHRLKSSVSSPDGAEKISSSQDSDVDDFGQNDGSFDFSVTGSATDLNDEGVGSFEDDGEFEVIQESKGMGFDEKKMRLPPSSTRSDVKNEPLGLEEKMSTLELDKNKMKTITLGLDKDKMRSSRINKDLQEVAEKMTGLVEKPSTMNNHMFEGERSVISSNSMTLRAKDWVKKVEDKKRVQKLGQFCEESPSAAFFVSAADDSSTFEYKKHDADINEDDSLFDFDKQPKSKTYNRKDGEQAAPHFAKRGKSDGERFTKREKNDSEAMSEITSPSEASEGPPRNAKSSSFLSRLQACTSPVFEEAESGQSMPQAHLAFLRNSTKDSQDNGIISMIKKQTLCGSVENVQESDINGLPPRVPSSAGSETKRGSNVASSYLQAVKKKTGSTKDWVKKDADNVKRVSSITSDSSSKSESWQKFLEKRNKALASGASTSTASTNSKAVEEYASAKVNEVLGKVTREGSEISFDGDKRAKSTARLRPPSGSNQIPRSLSVGRSRSFSRKTNQSPSKNDAAKAAEDLAAAKVEAMMSMISSSHLEGEI